MHSGVVLVRLDGCGHMLTMRAGRWAQVIVELGQVLLAVGLDPLSPGACGADVDEYIECSGKSGRLYFAIAEVAETHAADPLDRVARRSSLRPWLPPGDPLQLPPPKGFCWCSPHPSQ
ncbi:hypothetical protein [Streptomyces sp. NPDC048527]|uniref:hypothetical protein n=1 Tax=Streptomyces sp. NPDC048527 TaxID=3365568 RepID=UPI00371AB61A